MRGRTLALLGFIIGVSCSSYAKTLPADVVGQLGKEFAWSQSKVFEGQWAEGQKWDSWFCEGFYRYALSIKAGLKNVDFKLSEEGHMVVTAEVQDIHAGAQGAYRSKATMCLPVGGWLGVGSDWAKLRTEVHFGDGDNLKSVKLKILSTEVGRLEFGRFVPEWFENFFTGVLNRALTVVWNSKMGDWLSEKISKAVQENIPVR